MFEKETYAEFVKLMGGDPSQFEKQLKILKAYADGETIQWRNKKTNDVWREDGLDFLFEHFDYRVKPMVTSVHLAIWLRKDGEIGYTSSRDKDYLIRHYGNLSGFQIHTVTRED